LHGSISRAISKGANIATCAVMAFFFLVVAVFIMNQEIYPNTLVQKSDPSHKHW
jgi:hypothetical protein